MRQPSDPSSKSTAKPPLAFREEAEAAFKFLRSELGYGLVIADETFLRYENEAVFVNVYHGRSSYSVRFELGLLESPELQYYPEEVAALNGSDEETFFQASTPERLHRYVERLADLLRRHGSKLLVGDKDEFVRLQEVSDRMATAITARYVVGAAREEANLAWRRRDYPAVVETFSALGEHMSPAERQKLQYALKKLGRVQ